jgi:hypothetical protein
LSFTGHGVALDCSCVGYGNYIEISAKIKLNCINMENESEIRGEPCELYRNFKIDIELNKFGTKPWI